MTSEISIERRHGMITSARFAGISLECMPDDRNGNRQWRLTADDRQGHVRRMRLSVDEIAELAGLLQALAYGDSI